MPRTRDSRDPITRIRTIPLLLFALIGPLLGGTAEPRLDPGVLAPGDHIIALENERSYRLHVPPLAPQRGSVPLLLFLHPALADAEIAQAHYGLDEFADRLGFLVAYPDGTLESSPMGSRTWNAAHCCGTAHAQGTDDVEFLSAVVRDVGRRTALDVGPVTLAGHSNGAMMGYRFVAEAPGIVDRFVAVAGTVGGQRTPGVESVPSPPTDSPITMIIHARDDSYVLIDGGVNGSPYDGQRSDRPVIDGVRWMSQDREPRLETRWTHDDVDYELYGPPQQGPLLVIFEGGHAWPRGATGAPDATALVSLLAASDDHVSLGALAFSSRAHPISP